MAEKDKYADEIMSDEELDQVAGGTFDANMYSKEEYKAAGVAVDSHFLCGAEVIRD